MILNNLFRRKARTLLTVFGIAVGVAAVIALGAMADGFVQGYAALSSGSGADLLVMQDDALDIIFSAVDQELIRALTGLSGVERVTEMVYTFAATEGVPYFIVYGYDPEGFAIDHFKMVRGETLEEAGGRGNPGRRGGEPLLLGKAAAEDLDKEVGDTFRLYERVYRIVGIYETGEPFEDGAAVVSLEEAQAISGKPRQVNAFLIQVRDDADVERLQQRIEARYEDVTATTSTDFEQEQEWLQYIYAFTWTVSLVAVVIGGVGVMNTMLMSVFERTREIGVLRAVGWRPGQVLRMVLGESLVLSMLGGGVGTALGVGALRAVEQVPAVSSILPPAFSPGLFLQAGMVALLLGVVGGAIPAWRASRLLPAEAMRAESGATVHATRHVRSAALRDVLRQPVRTLLTVVGIGIAMLSIVLLGAMGEGMLDAFSGMAGGMGAQLIGIEAGASVDLSKIDEGTVRRMAAMPGVRAAEGFLTGYVSLGDLPFFIVFGYPARGLAIREFRIVEGEPLTTNRQILLGRVAAENLDRGVGQTVRIFERAFKVVGIYETGVPFQDGGSVLTLRDAQSLFGQPGKVSFAGVWLEEAEQAEQVARQIETRFPEVSLSKASAFAEDLTDMQALRSSTWAIAAMALIVGGLGMTKTMVMSVIERTREIGVLRALGWRQAWVVWMIVRESIVLSMLGSVAGVATGTGLGVALNALPVLRGFIRLIYTPGLMAQALGTALVLGVIGGAYPSWRAARLQPVEALRYE